MNQKSDSKVMNSENKKEQNVYILYYIDCSGFVQVITASNKSEALELLRLRNQG